MYALVLTMLMMFAAEGSVQEIIPKTVSIYDASGREIGTIEKKQLKLPKSIVAENRFGHLAIEHNGGQIYLHRGDVKYSYAGGCVADASGTQTSNYAASAPGLKAGAGGGEKSCVQR